MVIYWVTGLSQTFCHSMKMKTTRIWVALANDAQKIEVAVYSLHLDEKKKDLMAFWRNATKPKSLQSGKEHFSLFLISN